MSRQQTNKILKASHYFVRFMQLSCVGVTITKNLGVAHPSRTQLPAEQFLFSKESASKHPKDIRGVQLFLYIKYIKDLRKILSWLKIWINFLWYKSVIFFIIKLPTHWSDMGDFFCNLPKTFQCEQNFGLVFLRAKRNRSHVSSVRNLLNLEAIGNQRTEGKSLWNQIFIIN